MIKAIFFDVDGTLIPVSTRKIPTSTLEALNKLREKGIKLFVCTGRALPNIELIKDYFQFDGYVVTNGQLCLINDEIIYKNPINKDNVKNIIPYLIEHKIACDFIMTDHVKTIFINDRVLELEELLSGTEQKRVESDITNIENEDVFQLSPFVLESEEKDLYPFMPDCTSARWYPTFLDFFPSTGGKAAGIEAIIQQLGIKQEETMAFGDGGNDIDMLKYVHIGVCMGNGLDHVKQIADYVTKNADDDGIVHALKKYKII